VNRNLCDGLRFEGEGSIGKDTWCPSREHCAHYRRFARVPWAQRPYIAQVRLVEPPPTGEDCQQFENFTTAAFEQ
jgi:hypothetical protein